MAEAGSKASGKPAAVAAAGKKGGKVKPRKVRTPLIVRKAREFLGPAAGLAVAGAVVMNKVTGNDQTTPWYKMQHLSYGVAGKAGVFTRGEDDKWLILFSVVSLIFLRYLLQRLVFLPLAAATGITKRMQQQKYAEQGWQVMYYSTAWGTGLYVMLNTPGWNWMDTSQLWTSYPDVELPALTKCYYLFQLAFWMSQIFVTIVEEWRADFIEMMLHHIMTVNLIGWSYYLNFTRVGTAILVEQDLADIFLPLAKMFKYMSMQKIADVVFAIFAITWIPTRHGIYLVIYYSFLTEAPTLLKDSYDPSKGNYWSIEGIYYPFAVVLGLFQCLLLVWLKALLVAVYRALTSDGEINDQRSDNEDESEDEAGADKKKKDD